MDKCDILILTAMFGGGHLAVANAIQEYIQEIDPSIQIMKKDFYEIANPLTYKGMYKGYELLVKNAHMVVNRYYNIKNKNDLVKDLDTASKSNLEKLKKYIEMVRPSLIISTFPICTGYVSKLKLNENETIPLVTCITDVVDTNEWIYEGTDLYLVACKEVKQGLIAKGIQESKIKVTGIPIKKEFIQEDPSNVKLELGFRENDTVLLIMGGGLGLLPENNAFYEWLNELDHTKCVILTGKNKGLFNKLSVPQAYKNIQVIKYTTQVAKYMRASDLLISKAGGITLFEAIASELPMIVYKPVLGQEVINSQFIDKHRIGWIASNKDELKQTLLQKITDPQLRKDARRQLKFLKGNIDMEVLASSILGLYYSREIQAV